MYPQNKKGLFSSRFKDSKVALEFHLPSVVMIHEYYMAIWELQLPTEKIRTMEEF